MTEVEMSGNVLIPIPNPRFTLVLFPLLSHSHWLFHSLLLPFLYSVVRVQNKRWGNATFRIGPLTMVVCLSLAL